MRLWNEIKGLFRKKVAYEEGSGNIFKDLELPNADLEHAKADEALYDCSFEKKMLDINQKLTEAKINWEVHHEKVMREQLVNNIAKAVVKELKNENDPKV